MLLVEAWKAPGGASSSTEQVTEGGGVLPVEVEEEVGLRPMSMLSEAECPDLTSTASSSLEKKEEVPLYLPRREEVGYEKTAHYRHGACILYM